MTFIWTAFTSAKIVDVSVDLTKLLVQFIQALGKFNGFHDIFQLLDIGDVFYFLRVAQPFIPKFYLKVQFDRLQHTLLYAKSQEPRAVLANSQEPRAAFLPPANRRQKPEVRRRMAGDRRNYYR